MTRANSVTAERAGSHLETLARPPSVPARALRGAWRFARRKPFGAFGAAIILGLVLVALFAPVLAAYDPEASGRGARLLSPRWTHWMGTDNIGRDLFSRVVYGARVSLYVGIAASALGIGLGLAFGLLSGYAGGWLDNLIQRVMDVVLAFPGLILALGLVAMLGPSLRNVLIAISVGAIPNASRVVRGVVLGVKEEDYVTAARLLGATHPRIVLRHILPNTLAPVIVLASVGFGTAIIAEASLSFLGLGIPPPTPSWGAMLSGPSRRFMTTAPWMAVFPGLAISLVIFGVNMFGDALRDVLDPRLRGGR
jgi:peptide/nickel transport system permease protein